MPQTRTMRKRSASRARKRSYARRVRKSPCRGKGTCCMPQQIWMQIYQGKEENFLS